MVGFPRKGFRGPRIKSDLVRMVLGIWTYCISVVKIRVVCPRSLCMWPCHKEKAVDGR